LSGLLEKLGLFAMLSVITAEGLFGWIIPPLSIAVKHFLSTNDESRYHRWSDNGFRTALTVHTLPDV